MIRAGNTRFAACAALSKKVMSGPKFVPMGSQKKWLGYSKPFDSRLISPTLLRISVIFMFWCDSNSRLSVRWVSGSKEGFGGSKHQ